MLGNKSVPSSFGHFTEKLFDEYPIYEVKLPATTIDEYLPTKLPAFAAKSWKNMSKRHFFYSKPIVYATRCQISNDSEPLPSKLSLSNLLEDLLLENTSKIRYNFVIIGDALIFARVPRHRHISYHLLCKHISLANRSTDVRFAGEFWRDEESYFRLNNNSGTYRPSNGLLQSTIKLFNAITSLGFKGIDFRQSVQFPMQLQLSKEIQTV
ncbi:unnamed protein product [Adineta ricciae]|uniref:Uncharacterized protein n=1 Tax=Adineta ricciae TaxID=249248 RepID=A0A815LJ91_ADIRI|nr:unnamed protein product [Adineta ricciae]CAF1410118.1 unnamed protein product [Adineta ricciae]